MAKKQPLTLKGFPLAMCIVGGIASMIVSEIAVGIKQKTDNTNNARLEQRTQTTLAQDVVNDLNDVELVDAITGEPINLNYHTVGKGDTFYGISRKYGLPLDQLRGANPGVYAENLQIGQRIKFPSSFYNSQINFLKTSH